jgi:ubiquitin carboxyl-terminal hydrolase 16/45
LYGPPAAPEAFDPLAKLRAAHAGGLNGINSAKPQEYGLIESLRAFTSVETLEGDNAFACHKCWKIKNGHYKRGKENGDGGPFSSKRPSTIALPSIAVDDSEAEGAGGSTPGTTEMSRLGRLMSRGKGGVARAASPLRQLVDSTTSPESPDAPFSMSLPEDISRTETTLSTASATSATSMSSAATTDTSVTGATVGASTVFSASVPSTATAESFLTNDSDPTDKEADAAASSDGLSDSTDDEDLPSGSARFFRPPIRGRHTKHFVLRRAFKRYLIAKAPEVLVFHIKRFRQTGSGVYSTFSNLKK